MLAGSQNPMQLLMQAAQKNPELSNIINMAQQAQTAGVSPEQFFANAQQTRGYSTDDINQMLAQGKQMLEQSQQMPQVPYS